MAGEERNAPTVVLGLMSGTSMDGIDVCAVRIQGSDHLNFEILGFLTHPYPCGLKQDLLRVISNGGVQEMCSYNVLLGKLFADAALTAMATWGLRIDEVSLIGSHGQTIHHQPVPMKMWGNTVTSTLQIGDPSIIANVVGVTTVGDFRLADMSVEGQGAPLVPYLDKMLIERERERSGQELMLLNIGGISNLTVCLPGDVEGVNAGAEGCVLGFDCGPGNVLIDGLMQSMYSQSQDTNGDTASRGHVSKPLLDWLLQTDSFINRPPPKSTGREYYSKDFVQKIVSQKHLLQTSQEDCISTVTAFTAHAVWKNFEMHVQPLLQGHPLPLGLCVSGGGVHNRELMRCLRELFNPISVESTSEIGVPPDAKEALCFAVLAHETMNRQPTNIPSVTGAKRRVLLGKICPV